MAEAIASTEDISRCSICLDFLKHPVSLNCGHNYCLSCIEAFWNGEDVKGVYSCPQCRETFTPRPVVRKNTVLAELVDQMRNPVEGEGAAGAEEGCGESQVSDGQVLTAEPVTREDFLQYYRHFTLDPNTANTLLHLSEGNRKVEWRCRPQSYPDHPDRFKECFQVLCREGVSARCYWEVEWSENVGIAVSYKSISRKGRGDESLFGNYDQSWRLELSKSRAAFHYNGNAEEIKLPLVASSRIGVYVDHRAGTLAFYSIRGDTMILLHRVHKKFAHTLYPGFYVGGSVKLL